MMEVSRAQQPVMTGTAAGGGGIAGSLSLILVWGLGELGVSMPAEVSAAIVVVVMSVVAIFVPREALRRLNQHAVEMDGGTAVGSPKPAPPADEKRRPEPAPEPPKKEPAEPPQREPVRGGGEDEPKPPPRPQAPPPRPAQPPRRQPVHAERQPHHQPPQRPPQPPAQQPPAQPPGPGLVDISNNAPHMPPPRNQGGRHRLD